MECLAIPSLRFLVTSPDKRLINSNLFIHVHQETLNLRLLQYIHHTIYEKIQAESAIIKVTDSSSEEEPTELFGLGHISEYCLTYNSKIIELSDIVKNIESDSSSWLIQLEFKLCDKNFRYRQKLDYPIFGGFNTVNIHIQINTWSKEKKIDIIEYNIPLRLTIRKLKDKILEHLIRYETSEELNFCGIKRKHNVNDFESLRIKGKKTTIFLNDSQDSEIYNDATISELLNINFPSAKNSYYTLSFKLNHGKHNHHPNERYCIEFITEAKLTTNKMIITPETTVDDVKEYICSIYANSLRLYHRDIKLSFDGHHIHTMNAAGNLSKIAEYITELEGAKIHLQINQEYIEPGPGFWSELFSSPNRFNFMYTGSYWESERSAQTSRDTHNSEVNGINLAGPMKKPIKFTTESGLVIKRTGLLYEGIINEDRKEQMIPENYFNDYKQILTVDDDSNLQLSRSDYRTENGFINLTSDVIDNLLNERSRNFEQEEIKTDSARNIRVRRRRRSNQYLEYIVEFWSIIKVKAVHIYPLLSLCSSTVILVCFNIFFPLFIIYEYGTYFSYSLSLPVAVFLLVKISICFKELKEMWCSYLYKRRILSEESLSNMINFVDKGSLSIEFYKKCRDNINAIDVLLIPNLRYKRRRAYEVCGFKEVTSRDEMKHLKNLFLKTAEEEIPKSTLDGLYEAWLRSFRKSLETSIPKDLNDFIILLKEEMQKS
ncbi:hypothetical protein Kpol_1004p52 [Vanderwaltozyma polyspora DSM 70294]|uniref:Uncharacterized protein n=1 Tax=Vanderwaltozyma polyspora (strain ATCC 22028 / DSM 70294 / BCRC 21397 / CBS 2163 / NBRC 10782 / NRRL Y-8283 / UCD 57-17) TaxID=436907 RepID=A7TJA8_VANPO|nr:uncharacterized protein Kpol_1004p52 [Vanderwaltozyma polyspora DSM 70294]EDO17677.1 hypothetical protein Kpol_1004p52 [Vanderwaltozyma polyspora DSM 70294]